MGEKLSSLSVNKPALITAPGRRIKKKTKDRE
jgi:hypothetical protein